MKKVKFGIDVLQEQNPNWKTKRLAFVTNKAAKTNTGVESTLALLNSGFNIVRLFSPEHGFDVSGADGAKIMHGVHQNTQIPIISLYGDYLEPDEHHLKDIDLIIFDIPDIGTRFYTYLWTLTYILEACKKQNKQLVILDRPNPISGKLELCEGPRLDEKNCSSFIGRWDIPLRHSCTLGELAKYFNKTKNLNIDLEVITCENWDRSMFQPQWGIDFVPPSPAMRTFSAAILYPGLGLLEATNLSEGRGTLYPFEWLGAPWLNVSHIMIKDETAGLSTEVLNLEPLDSKYANERCRGIKFNVEDYMSFKPIYNCIKLIKRIKDSHPTHFAWAQYPTNVNPSGEQHLNKLLGIKDSELLFELSAPDFEIKLLTLLTPGNWSEEVKPFLLYN